jgi:hypothetical protein
MSNVTAALLEMLTAICFPFVAVGWFCTEAAVPVGVFATTLGLAYHVLAERGFISTTYLSLVASLLSTMIAALS